MKKIAFLIIGTNNYIDLACNCSESIHKYINIEDCSVSTILLSNRSTERSEQTFQQICPIDHLPWPLITLLRYHYFMSYKDILSKYDYLYYIDADMEVVAPIGKEIIGERVVTKHPGLWGRDKNQLPYDRNPLSSAYIPHNMGGNYYFGALQGGSKDEFLKMSDVLANRINLDLKNNYIALWHDESQLNKYYLHQYPDVILDQSYAYPEKWNLPFTPKILAKDKNHEQIRTENYAK